MSVVFFLYLSFAPLALTLKPPAPSAIYSATSEPTVLIELDVMLPAFHIGKFVIISALTASTDL